MFSTTAQTPLVARPAGHLQTRFLLHPWSDLLAPANIPNWLLVVVGALAATAAYSSLRAIKRQSDLMDRQLAEMRTAGVLAQKTAQAADRSAEAALAQIKAMKDKERARLSGTLKPFMPFESRSNPFAVVMEGEISIAGSTEAYILETEAYASIGLQGINNPLPEWVLSGGLPDVVRPGGESIPLRCASSRSDRAC